LIRLFILEQNAEFYFYTANWVKQ